MLQLLARCIESSSEDQCETESNSSTAPLLMSYSASSWCLTCAGTGLACSPPDRVGRWQQAWLTDHCRAAGTAPPLPPWPAGSRRCHHPLCTENGNTDGRNTLFLRTHTGRGSRGHGADTPADTCVFWRDPACRTCCHCWWPGGRPHCCWPGDRRRGGNSWRRVREWCPHRNGGRIAKRNRGKTCGKRLQKIVNETDILVKVQANLSYIHNHHHSLQEHFWWHCSYPQPHSWCPWQDRGESILKNTLCVLIWLLNYFNSNYLKSPCISVDCCCIHQSCWCCCWLGWGAKFPPWHPASLVSKYFQ